MFFAKKGRESSSGPEGPTGGGVAGSPVRSETRGQSKQDVNGSGFGPSDFEVPVGHLRKADRQVPESSRVEQQARQGFTHMWVWSLEGRVGRHPRKRWFGG